ncbi:MAG: NAD(P)/FAD-dependent oxidoreductase [Oscillospiraceae bacterium]
MIQYDTIVVGAGAAGLLCAGILQKQGKTVALVEKNPRVGRKLMITGKGRCNLTNNCTPDDFIKSVMSNGRFLYSAINSFSPEDTMKFFEELGIPLKTERGARVFPISDKAVDIVDALDKFAKGKSIDRVNRECEALYWENGILGGVVCSDGTKISAKNVVVATGGLSYPQTGSTGTGYTLAKQAGHSIIEPKGSLVPIVTHESCCKEMMGLSLKNVTLTLIEKDKNKKLYSELGEMLFTHFGISGPLVLSASSYMKNDMSSYKIEIDLKPGLTMEQLDRRLLRDFDENINRDFANSLGQLLPRKMIPVIIKLSGIPFECKVNQITKEQRQKLCELIKNFEITPKALRPVDEAIVTAGGVSVKEVSPKTMESKITNNLYFIGEVLDLDAYTGGFNLQIAFSTAYAAAMAIALK